jgi:ATP-dependent RNA helicase RhlE
MGFIHDIRKIMKALPAQRQNLMFSATFSDDIRELAKGIVNNPVEISVSPKNSTATSVKQWIHPVDKKQKPSLLVELINKHKWGQVLVFSRTKHGANKLVTFLEKNRIKAAAIHGNKSQGARTRALADFKAGKVNILDATDIAARGLDIEQLPQVVNLDLPNIPEDYVHRIGRTGRAGASGQAVSLVSADEFQQLSDIERLIQTILKRELVDGFEPDHDVPASRLRPPAKPSSHKKKHHNPRTEHRDGQHSRTSSGNSEDSNRPRRKPYGGQQTAGNSTNNNRRSAKPSNSAPRSPNQH